MDVVLEKLVAMSVLGLGTFLIGIVPLKIVYYFQMNSVGGDGHTTGGPDFSAITTKASTIVYNLLCFASGVLLFTSILRLQPGVRKQLESVQDTRKIAVSIENLGDIMFCFGFLAFFFIDEFAHFLLNRWMARRADWNSVVVLAQSLSLTRSNIRRISSSVPPMTGCMPLVTILEVPEEYEDNRATSAEGQPNTNTTDNIPTESNDNEYKELQVIFRYLFTVIALSFHEVFQGMAIGMEYNIFRVRCLLVTETTHKLVIGFSIGLDMAWSNVRKSVAVLYLVMFTVTMPVGILLGMWFIDNLARAEPTVLAFQGFGDGALFYVMVFDIVTRHKKQGFPYYVLSTALGFSVMLLLQIMSKSTMTCSIHVNKV
ncbi:Zinc/iron permease [Cinara cedri]|uniref:Zinc/iron permease n=1 Tax=Cinara cedri TaxID=506608 RepID=A0A5E4NRR9_9HEMI|nr:Zinc/iron permease [Cinara cedri]